MTIPVFQNSKRRIAGYMVNCKKQVSLNQSTRLAFSCISLWGPWKAPIRRQDSNRKPLNKTSDINLYHIRQQLNIWIHTAPNIVFRKHPRHWIMRVSNRNSPELNIRPRCTSYLATAKGLNIVFTWSTCLSHKTTYPTFVQDKNNQKRYRGHIRKFSSYDRLP